MFLIGVADKMGFVKFLKFLKVKVIKVIKSRRVADRVAAVDLGEDNDRDVSMKFKGVFSWEEIRRLTMNFSDIIGYGGFSTVYLARFHDNVSIVAAAVKVQCGSSEHLNRAYEQELGILRLLDHPNIVKLIGHCNDTEEGILVMEYVPNGTLQEALHSSKTVLPWKKRVAIAFQLAQAMDHLHNKCSLQIVHGDIKSSNVLLDTHLNCKLCDFGSAKMGFSAMVTPPSSRNRSRAMMMGSPGYTDPHYLRTGLASTKTDVYSFGVILLELISGGEAFDPKNGKQLRAKAQPMLQDSERVVEMIDRRLRAEFVLHEAKTLAALATACLVESPGLRPCASDILVTMKQEIPSLSRYAY